MFMPTGVLALDPSVFSSDGVASEVGFNCTGNEANLLDCSISSTPDCSPLHQAAVLCQGITYIIQQFLTACLMYIAKVVCAGTLVLCFELCLPVQFPLIAQLA